MPQLTVEVPHQLGQEEAARRLKARFDALRGTYQTQVSEATEEWRDHTLFFGFRAMGMKVSGTLAVEPALVRVDAELPFAAMMVKGMIEQRVRDELGKMLA